MIQVLERLQVMTVHREVTMLTKNTTGWATRTLPDVTVTLAEHLKTLTGCVEVLEEKVEEATDCIASAEARMDDLEKEAEACATEVLF